MKKIVCTMASLLILASCATQEKKDDFDYTVESFADLEILRYKVPGFEELTLQQKELPPTVGTFSMTRTENGTWLSAVPSKQSIRTIPATAKAKTSRTSKYT